MSTESKTAVILNRIDEETFKTYTTPLFFIQDDSIKIRDHLQWLFMFTFQQNLKTSSFRLYNNYNNV